uniref:Uncharacterized protein n=1 Tax=Arundo donax TaxID=35708 RepID=A0A0A9HDQ6_ARUDO
MGRVPHLLYGGDK